MSDEFEKAKTYQSEPSDWLASKWGGFKSPAQISKIRNTGVFWASLIKAVFEK